MDEGSGLTFDPLLARKSTSNDPAAGGGSTPSGVPGDSKTGGDEGNAAVGAEPAIDEENTEEGPPPSEDVEKFYPVEVALLCGKLTVTLELAAADTVADVRQLLADTPESCYYTCFGLTLIKNGEAIDLGNDFQELGELVDFEAEAEAEGSVSIAMHERVYNLRGVHEHVQRFRELISLDQCYSSPSSLVEGVNNVAAAGDGIEGAQGAAGTGQQQGGGANGKDAPATGSASGDKKKKKKKKPSNKSKNYGKGGGSGGGRGRSNSDDSAGKTDEEAGTEDGAEAIEYDESFTNAGLGSEFPSMVELAPRAPPVTPMTIKELQLSSWSPPSDNRCLVGDLLYFDLTTLEKRTYCVTAHCRGFFVNKSTANAFDPRPANSKLKPYQTLVALMQSLSQRFNEAFSELQHLLVAMHPLEAQPPPPPPGLNTFFTPIDSELQPAPQVASSFGRAEDSLHNWTGGWDAALDVRDWNEEYQSCRELPSATLPERLLRDRTLYRIMTDFVAAATQGAKLVVEGNVTALNPADAVPYQMYVHNGIFYSYAHDLDADEEQSIIDAEDMQQGQGREGADGAVADAEASPGETGGAADSGGEQGAQGDKEPLGDEEDLFQDIEYLEQATFVSANNDMRGTKAFADADVNGLHTVSMVIVDYCGSRLIAHSIIPGILHGDRNESLKYGSVDGGKKTAPSRIAWDTEFHERVTQAARACFIKEHLLRDAEGNEYKFAAPSECKGIEGSDGRFYLLDLVRVTPRDVLWTGRSSSCALMRPELIRALCRREEEPPEADRDAAASGEASDDSPAKPSAGGSEGNGAGADQDGKGAIARSVPSIEDEAWQKSLPPLNPNASTETCLGGAPDDIQHSEDLVRHAADVLRRHVIPRFVADCKSLDSIPLDGVTLTEFMHSAGINMRYLGMVAEHASSLPHLKQLCVCEIVARCAKHELRSLLRNTLPHGRADAISRFLNALVGSWSSVKAPSSPAAENGHLSAAGKKRSRMKRRAEANAMSLVTSSLPDDLPLDLTHEGVFNAIRNGADARFQYDMARSEYMDINKLALMRSVCLKVGISLLPRDYNFSSVAPVTIDDVQRLEPVAKSMIDTKSPVISSATSASGSGAEAGDGGCCRDGRTYIELGKAQMLSGNLPEAIDLLNEATAILTHVYGPLHRDVGCAAKLLAMCLYHNGEIERAIEEQRRELLINERVLGPEHRDTIQSYASLALFHHGLGHGDTALRYMHRVLQLHDLVCGRDHPDCTTSFVNIAMMYQEVGKIDVALRYLQEALTRTERLLGATHNQAAVCYHAMAVTFNCAANYKLALAHEKNAYTIFKKNLGDDDRRTKHAMSWMRQFTVKELQQKDMRKRAIIQQQQQQSNPKGTANVGTANVGAVPGLNFANMTRGRPGGRRNSKTKVNNASANAAAGGATNTTVKANKLNTKSVDEMLQFIEGVGGA